MRAPKSCSQSSTLSRRETRFLSASVATAACRRGPNALWASSAGSSPVRSAPQPGQRARTHCDQVALTEEVPALATLGPVTDDLVHGRDGQQFAPAALMTGLGALRSPR